MTNVRLLACCQLAKLLQQKGSLANEPSQSLNAQDHALYLNYVYGVCRDFFRLVAISQQLLQKPFKNKDQDLLAALLLGLHDILNCRTPDHAAVHEAVKLTQALKKSWASKVLNACLRNFLRQRENLLAKVNEDLTAAFNHPQWLIERIQQAYPNEWQAILTENQKMAPMVLRVNLQKTSRDEYLARLSQAGITAKAATDCPRAIVLSQAIPVDQLPGFDRGHCSIQDSAAQQAARALDLCSNMRVLDACAAPGGKTLHCLETEPTIELIALDKSAERSLKLSENLRRANKQIKIIQADATDVTTWWDGKPFDRILLDAPCSGTGVIRRHPDIKLCRRESDILSLQSLQIELINRLWPLLKPGGIMLYITCSILPEENGQVVKTFLAQQNNAIINDVACPHAITHGLGTQCLPGGSDQQDGFFYAKFEKQAHGN